jgi:hypothetical protein
LIKIKFLLNYVITFLFNPNGNSSQTFLNQFAKITDNFCSSNRKHEMQPKGGWPILHFGLVPHNVQGIGRPWRLDDWSVRKIYDQSFLCVIISKKKKKYYIRVTVLRHTLDQPFYYKKNIRAIQTYYKENKFITRAIGLIKSNALLLFN